MPFKRLPRVKKCCCFKLKQASTAIAVIFFINGLRCASSHWHTHICGVPLLTNAMMIPYRIFTYLTMIMGIATAGAVIAYVVTKKFVVADALGVLNTIASVCVLILHLVYVLAYLIHSPGHPLFVEPYCAWFGVLIKSKVMYIVVTVVDAVILGICIYLFCALNSYSNRLATPPAPVSMWSRFMAKIKGAPPQPVEEE